ncbi:MAG: type I-MYXAN CRISPR-associated endonuclease Cas1 [Myxococcota bacterium]
MTLEALEDARLPTVRVMALHALLYCERLFFLEEVEEIRVADEAVWAGRVLHAELDEPAEVVELTLESARLGMRGKVDALRKRDGTVFPVEHKRGRARRTDGGPGAWDADRVQAAAYAMLLEEHLGRPVAEARIRYHRDNVTVRIPITDVLRTEVALAVRRARELARFTERPPVTTDERKCVRCSLAPVCLPEEVRLAQAEDAATPTPLRLFPADSERRSLHVLTQGARVSRSGEGFTVVAPDETPLKVGAREVGDITLHGYAQITTQALRLCADERIPVHLVTMSGSLLGTFSGPSGGVQRRIRQYRGLTDDDRALSLARRLLHAKVEMQLRHVLRASRGDGGLRPQVDQHLRTMRSGLSGLARAADRDALMGNEGLAARAYFGALSVLVSPEAGEELRPAGRSQRPPRDRFNALLSFGYALLERDIFSAVLRVGLEPAFGVLHQPRSAAWPLVLDLMELFRVPVVDMAVMAAVNRRTFDPAADFTVTGPQVWLSEEGRKKLIGVYERRKKEEYRHSAIGYALSYERMMELEVRLLEKEWSGEPGLFARFRIR